MQDASSKVGAAILGSATLLKISAIALAIAVLGLASSAQAGTLGRPCTSAPENQWLSIDELRAKVEGLGYTVKKAKLKNACGELYAIDKNGSRAELFVDPTNGQVVGQL